MILTSLLLVNNLALFIIEVIGYHVCHSGKLSRKQNSNDYSIHDGSTE